MTEKNMFNFDDLMSGGITEEINAIAKNAVQKPQTNDEDTRKAFLGLSESQRKAKDTNIIVLRLIPSKYKTEVNGSSFPQLLVRNTYHVFEEGTEKHNLKCMHIMDQFGTTKETKNNACPLCKRASSHYNTNDDEYRRLRKGESVWTNAYFIKNSLNKELEGQTKLVYIKPIVNELEKALAGKVVDNYVVSEPLSLFDLINGYDIIVTVEPSPKNPDKWSEYSVKFEKRTFLDGNKEEIKKVFDQTHDLAEFCGMDRIKTCSELETIIESFSGDADVSPKNEFNKGNSVETVSVPTAPPVPTEAPKKESTPAVSKPEKNEEDVDVDFESLFNN